MVLFKLMITLKIIFNISQIDKTWKAHCVDSCRWQIENENFSNLIFELLLVEFLQIVGSYT